MICDTKGEDGWSNLLCHIINEETAGRMNEEKKLQWNWNSESEALWSWTDIVVTRAACEDFLKE